MISVGEISVTPVVDTVVRRVPTEAYDAMSEADWSPHAALLDDQGMLHLTLGGYVVRTGDRLVLVDAGIGPEERPVPGRGITMPGGRMLENLEAAGIPAGAVTDVVFTHLHLDHVGWGSVDGEITFPNATYRCHRADWDYFKDGAPLSSPEKLAAIAPRLDCWEGSWTLTPGMDLVEAPGHTPGSSIVVLSSGRQRGVLLGDVVHCPVELVDEEWQTIGDVDPALARRTATELARELEGGEVLVGAAHFSALRFGRLLLGEGRRSWVFHG